MMPLISFVGKDHQVLRLPPAVILLSADGDLTFPIAVDVAGRDAHVVPFGEVAGDNVFGPSRVLVPR